MPIFLSLLTWLGVMVVGLGLVLLIILGMNAAGMSDGVQQTVSFILGMPVGVVATLSAFAVYDRTY